MSNRLTLCSFRALKTNVRDNKPPFQPLHPSLRFAEPHRSMQISWTPTPSSRKGCPLPPAPRDNETNFPGRRLARWGVLPLILLVALAACEVTHEDGTYKRSYVTGSSHRDGDPLNIVGLKYKF